MEPDPLDVIAHIAPRPLLLIHGSADTMIPVSESEALFAAAGEPAELWIAEGADHIETYEHDPEGFRERVLDFLGRWVAPPCG